MTKGNRLVNVVSQRVEFVMDTESGEEEETGTELDTFFQELEVGL